MSDSVVEAGAVRGADDADVAASLGWGSLVDCGASGEDGDVVSVSDAA